MSPTPVAPEAAADPIILSVFSAGDAVERDWRKVKVWGEASFDLVALENEIAIRARTEESSAALVRRMEIDPQDCPIVEWSWRVDQMPQTADLTSRKSEDVAASVFFAFGDPGPLLNPAPVPTLRYAWATEENPVDEVIDSPYFPGILRTVVVRSGREALGGWVTERRNLIEDYARAFGEAPENAIEVVAIFTDSDHGPDTAEAYYRWAQLECLEGPEAPSIFDE